MATKCSAGYQEIMTKKDSEIISKTQPRELSSFLSSLITTLLLLVHRKQLILKGTSLCDGKLYDIFPLPGLDTHTDDIRHSFPTPSPTPLLRHSYKPQGTYIGTTFYPPSLEIITLVMMGRPIADITVQPAVK